MGIFAKGSQFPADVVVDTPQNRYGGQFTKDSAAGDALGGVISDVNSTAESANTTAGEIIADIEELEGRVAAIEGDPGPDLSGYATNSSVDTKVSNAFGPLEGRVTTLENAPGPDLSGYATNVSVDTKVSNAFGPLEGRVDATNSDIEALDGRVTTLENDPGPDLSAYATNSSVDTKVSNAFGPLEGRVTTLENDPGPDLSGYATNASVDTLEGRVTTLENAPGPDLSGYATNASVDTKVSNAFEVETISGTGWSARKQGNVLVLTIYGATAGWTMPQGWRPAATTFATAVSRVDGANVLARVSILGGGGVGLHDATGPFYASIPYFTP